MNTKLLSNLRKNLDKKKESSSTESLHHVSLDDFGLQEIIGQGAFGKVDNSISY